MQTYSVELIFGGDTFEENDISGRLGIRSTTFVKKGETKSPKRKWERTTWSFEVVPSPDDRYWKSLEEGLTHLLDRLDSVKSVIDEMKQSYHVFICCGQFASGFGGGPSFSPALLKRLANLGLELSISTYWSRESETGNASNE